MNRHEYAIKRARELVNWVNPYAELADSAVQQYAAPAKRAATGMSIREVVLIAGAGLLVFFTLAVSAWSHLPAVELPAAYDEQLSGDWTYNPPVWR